MRTSATVAYSSGDNGHPCRTPVSKEKPGVEVVPCFTSQCELEYNEFNKLMALWGMPMWCNVAKRNSLEMDGNTDAKSSRMQAPSGCVSEVIMAAVSTWRRLVSMDLPRRNPCWRGKIQPARWVSHLLRAAEATMRLSQLTILSGRVLFGEYALVPSSAVVVRFLIGRQACCGYIGVRRW